MMHLIWMTKKNKNYFAAFQGNNEHAWAGFR